MITTEKKPLVIINGPTAVGKTAVSVELAERLGAEIISADSMQIYRYMDIGTAKATREEMRSVPHHMIDILNPDEDFSVLKFKETAKDLIADIHSRGHLPIIAGGTGFYIQAVLYDIEFSEYDDEKQHEIRNALELKLKKNGALYMHEYLRIFDPESAAVIHPNNIKRLLHAIEFFELTGTKISNHNAEQKQNESPYDFKYFVITDDRVAIYKRIDDRVEVMLANGLENEVRYLLDKGYAEELPSMLGIGYKEMIDYIKGRVTYDEAVYNIKRETRHFAKKQLTWFKREKVVEYINRNDYKSNIEIADELENRIKKHFYRLSE